jgi:hypothetical protein
MSVFYVLHNSLKAQATRTITRVSVHKRRTDNGDSGKEALRALKRRLSYVVHRAMIADAQAATSRAHDRTRPAA